MGFYLKKNVQNAIIGIWEINESVEELYNQVTLSQEEETIYSCLKTQTRKQHWLSYRLILPQLVSRNELSAICYDEYGKPFLNNGVRHISVSHSGKFSALIASPSLSVGIDIEHIESKILKIHHKFLNDKEISEIGPSPCLQSLYVIWAAKEALYKLHGKRNILFREHIYIAPFRCDYQGTVYGTIDCDSIVKSFTIHYELLEDYILAYAIDK
jgi:4'-phosphopantetheinyl transferase